MVYIGHQNHNKNSHQSAIRYESVEPASHTDQGHIDLYPICYNSFKIFIAGAEQLNFVEDKSNGILI